ncbi:hypothetical protein BGZ51_004377 [Haplosporangium sp. Z 767]|nr:hypothetical protein BGZ51_004377 [Haplosporangium sp. Z 767]KAF9184962.1 hypothetical protein BGZ50_003370 [Haplosporangium sp. Z 11]
MTSQPLVASVCVDYLSHPLSTEHLLVCYQQITRQVAHAPQSAKDAAKSFQHQSQTLLQLLGQNQILEDPKAKERPAPVGCQSQLRRMQNALWRRSSQSSLAKDVGLVRPESLNWQKECDVLWLYGPLYEVDIVQLEQPHPQPKWQQEEQGSYHRQHGRVQLAAATAVIDSPPESPRIEISDALETPSEAPTFVEEDATAISTPSAIPPSSSLSISSSPSSASSAEEPSMTDTTSYSTSSTTPTTAISHADSLPSTESSLAPNPDTESASAAAKNTLIRSTTAVSPTDSTTLIRPHKSALKRQRTMMQLFEELRAFTHSPEYLALSNFLAVAHAATPSTLACATALDGTRSEPISPISNDANSPFVLPIFSTPTKYHFRSHDRRRASFPKSASHPSRLNVNVNVNLNASTHGGFVSSKQLRFSLEVQELVFLPTSPPFRISRAKPTRAHSDPAVQTTAHSSFIAPTHHSAWPPNPSLLQQQQNHHSSHQGRGLISTATASIPSYMDTTTTRIKIQATDPPYSKTAASKRYMEQEEDDGALDCHLIDDFDDEYLFASCRDDDDEDVRYDDDDVIHGIGSAGSRFRLASKGTIVARRANEVDPHRAGPVTFNVVGLRDDPADEFGVVIDGKVTKLQTTKEIYPLWSANIAGIDGPLEYQYVHLSKDGKATKEQGPRKLPAGAAYTPNDFFDRLDTISELPPLPQVFDNKLHQNSAFFREGYIGSLFIEGDQKAWKYINKGGVDWDPKPMKIQVQYIGANENVKINNATLQLSGGGTRAYSKLPYKLKFPKTNSLLDLSSLKLRSAERDATMMREKLFVDILNSLGVPTQQASYVRLYFNKEPVGLYIGMEEIKKHWIKKVLHPDNSETSKLGSLWKMDSCCGSAASLEWLGPTTKSYPVSHYKNFAPGQNPEDNIMKDLIQLMSDLKNYDPKKVKDPIAYWEQRIDLDVFLRAMAMEHLAGSWDGYWRAASNYQMYNDPITGKWLWIPIDFDDTFGTYYGGEVESYRNMPKKSKKGFETPLVYKLIIETPEINVRFEKILKDIVQYVFKPQALMPRIDAYKKMIYHEVEWDRSLPRVSNGRTEKFSIKDLSDGIVGGTKSTWTIKSWIEARTKQIERDMKFKVLSGTPSKVAPHVMTQLQSAFGIVPKQATSPAPESKEAPPAPASVDDNSEGGNSEGDDSEDYNFVTTGSSMTGSTSPTLQVGSNMNSAETLKGKWIALSAVAAVVALAL